MVSWKWIVLALLALFSQEQEGVRQWTGRKAAEDGSWQVMPQPEIGDLRTRLAEAWLQYEVDRDVACAEDALAQLWIESTAAPVGTERVGLWAAIAQKRAQLAVESGKPEIARELLTVMDAGVPESAWQGYEIAETRLPQTAVAIMAAVREVGAPAEQGDPIERAVRDAMKGGAAEVAYELGARALPVLERMALERPDEMPHVQTDPLVALFEMAEMRGARFVQQNWSTAGYLWKKRVLRAMESADVLTDEGTWRVRPDRQYGDPGQLVETAWADVVGLFVADRELRAEAISVLDVFVRNDALTPELQVALAGVVRSTDPDVSLGAAKLFREPQFGVSHEPIYEAMLESPHASVRRLGAERLLGYRESGLARCSEDPDPYVRLTVAKLLQPREYTLVDQYNYRFTHEVEPVDLPEVRAAIARLVDDPDPAVRFEAAVSVIGQEIPFDEAVYSRMASDPDLRIRRLLVESDVYAQDSIRGRVFAELASDPDPDIRRALDQRLVQDHGALDSDQLLDAVEKRVLDRVVPPEEPGNLLLRFGFTEAGLAKAIEWSLSSLDPRLLEKLVLLLTRERGPGLSVLSAEDCVRLLRATQALDPGTLALLVRAPAELPEPKRRHVCLEVLQDERFEWVVRLQAASVLAGFSEDPEIERMVGEFLEASPWDAMTMDRDKRQVLRSIAHGARERDWRAFPVQVLRSDSIPHWPKQDLLTELAEGRLDREWYIEVLKRWLGDGGSYNLIRSSLLALAEEDEVPVDLLIAASRDPNFVEVAVSTMVGSRSSAFNDAYLAILRSDWNDLTSRAGKHVHRLAVQGLTANLDADAARRLLDAIAWVGDDEVRQWCFDGLDTIRRYEQERRRWARERDEADRRTEAEAELATMLDDDDPGVREAALRSLAAIAGSAVLPKAVALLRDEDPDVRDAAREVIEGVGPEPVEPPMPGEPPVKKPAKEPGEADSGD